MPRNVVDLYHRIAGMRFGPTLVENQRVDDRDMIQTKEIAMREQTVVAMPSYNAPLAMPRRQWTYASRVLA